MSETCPQPISLPSQSEAETDMSNVPKMLRKVPLEIWQGYILPNLSPRDVISWITSCRFAHFVAGPIDRYVNVTADMPDRMLKQRLAFAVSILETDATRSHDILHLILSPNAALLEERHGLLFWASFKGYHSIVSAILNYTKASPRFTQTKDLIDPEALIYAIVNKHTDITQDLLSDTRLDLSTLKYSALKEAVRHKDVALTMQILKLIQSQKIDLDAEELGPVCTLAASIGHFKLYRSLIRLYPSTLSPNAASFLQESLILAVEGHHWDIVMDLLTDPRVTPTRTEFIIEEAITAGELCVVRCMLRNPRIEHTSELLFTGLSHALSWSSNMDKNMIQYLVHHPKLTKDLVDRISPQYQDDFKKFLCNESC